MERKGSMSDENIFDDPVFDTPPASPSRRPQKPVFSDKGWVGNNAVTGAGGDTSAQVLSESFSRLSSSGSKAGALEALVQEEGRPETTKSLPLFPQPGPAPAHDHDDSPSYYRSPSLQDDAIEERRATPEELDVEEEDEEEEEEEEEEGEGEEEQGPLQQEGQASGGGGDRASRRIVMEHTDEGTVAQILRGGGMAGTDEGSVARVLRGGEPSPHRPPGPSPLCSTLDSLQPPDSSPTFVSAPLIASLHSQGGGVAVGGGRSPRWSLQPIDTSHPTDPASPPPIPPPSSASGPLSPRSHLRASVSSTASGSLPLPVVPEERPAAPPRSRRRNGPLKEEHMDISMEQRMELFLAYSPQPSKAPSPRASSPRPTGPIADAALARSSTHPAHSRHPPKEQQAPHTTQHPSSSVRRRRSSSADSDNRRSRSEKPRRTRRATLHGSQRLPEQVVHTRLYALHRTQPAVEGQTPTEEHTFQPKLHTQHWFRTHNSPTRDTHFSERLHDMQGWFAYVKKMEEKRKSLEVQGCTFRPDVSRTASPARDGEPAWKRLFDKAPQWEQSKATTRKLLADAEMAQCTFTPELATRSKSPQKREQEQDGEPASKPKGRCHERLYGEALKRFDRLDTKAKAPLPDCTFAPSIQTMRRGGKDSTYRGSGRVRHTELYIIGHERVTKLRLIEESKKPPKPDDSDETHCTFFPVTNWARRVQRGEGRRTTVLGDAVCW